MKRNGMIIALAGSVLVLIVLVIFQNYYSTERKVLSDYQSHMLLHAQHLADEIEDFFEERSLELQALSSFVSLQYGHTKKGRKNIRDYFETLTHSKEMKGSYVRDLFWYDETGRIVDSASGKEIGSNHGNQESFLWAMKRENRGKKLVSSLPLTGEEKQNGTGGKGPSAGDPEARPFEFSLTLPLYQDSRKDVHSQTDSLFMGALSFNLDLKEFLARGSRDHKLNPHEIWIIDKRGKLLFSSSHPEMVARNIYNKEDRCVQCHVSFDYIITILKKKQGIADYRVRNFPEKVAAFAPVDFEDLSWIVVVNSPYEGVTGFIRKSLWQHLVLLGIVVLTFGAGSAVIIRHNKASLRIEEEVRHGQLKRSLEDKIEQSELLYRTIIETAHDMIWVLNPQGNFTFINKSMVEMLGYENSEIIGEKFWYLLQLMDLPEFNDLFQKTLQGEAQSCEIRFMAKDKKVRILSVDSVPFYEKDKIIGVLSFGRDITGSREAEKALRASEEKWRVLVGYVPQKIYLKDKNSIYQYCNDNFAQDFNVRPDGIIGKTDYDLSAGEIAEKEVAEDKRVIESGRTVDAVERYSTNGQDAIVHRLKTFTRDEKGNIVGILGISWDVTEKVRLESIAEAVNTMNNIGYVFSGIRHEIGNPVSTAKMVLSVLKKQVDVFSKETVVDYIDRAMGEIYRVEYLLQVLKNFNMYEILEPQGVEIKPFLDKFLSLIAGDFTKRGITIESAIDPGIETVHVDPRALQQVLLNVMSNASDALNGREDPKISMAILKERSMIRIKIFDNGCGISEEQQKELFKPFRTTKPNGTGLGLVIARKMLVGMAGTIQITSRKDEGTTVDISLPEGREGSNGTD